MSNNSTDRLFRGIAIGFVIIGLCLAFGSWLTYHRTRAFLASAVSTTGQVIDRTRTSTVKDATYYHVIQFTTDDDKRITVTLRSRSRGWDYAVGRRVPMLYLPADPQHAMLDTFGARWFASIAFGVMGIGFSGMGMLAFMQFRPLPRRAIGQPKQRRARL
jgi:hypothetical protein